MRRWMLGLSATFAVAVLGVLAVGRQGVRAGEGAVPEGQYRVAVNDVLREDQIVVTRVEVTAPPRAMVRVFTDVPDKGGLSIAAPDAPRDGSPPERVRLTIVGDHVTWAHGPADLVKFLLRAEGGSGMVSMSSEGPMPEKTKDLKGVVSVQARPGTYRLGTPVEFCTHDGTAYRLVVERPSGS